MFVYGRSHSYIKSSRHALVLSPQTLETPSLITLSPKSSNMIDFSHTFTYVPKVLLSKYFRTGPEPINVDIFDGHVRLSISDLGDVKEGFGLECPRSNGMR